MTTLEHGVAKKETIGPSLFQPVVDVTEAEGPTNMEEDEKEEEEEGDQLGAFHQKKRKIITSKECSKSPTVTSTGKTELAGLLVNPCQYGLVVKYTRGFDRNNILGNTMFGVLYRGKFPCELGTKNITVKVWGNVYRFISNCPDAEDVVMNELRFLESPLIRNHPDFVKVVGHGIEHQSIATMYDLDPMDTLSKLIVKDSFSWIQRIEVAHKFAELLEYLHREEDPYMVRNLEADHIIIDQDFNPRLIDFSRLIGIKGQKDSEEYDRIANLGYDAPEIYKEGKYYVKSDVYSYGVILLSLIAKRVYKKIAPPSIFTLRFTRDKHRVREPFVGEWAVEEFGRRNNSLVHESLQKEGFDKDLGMKITTLGLRCLDCERGRRPTMVDIVSAFKEWLKPKV